MAAAPNLHDMLRHAKQKSKRRAEENTVLRQIIGVMNTISRHQTDRTSHPLTCGNDSNHTLLFPVHKDDTVKLVCRDCGYEQKAFYPKVKP